MKDKWLRTRGGTLVVPPAPSEAKTKPPQAILPLGALVESLGCTVEWSKRKGLKVTHKAGTPEDGCIAEHLPLCARASGVKADRGA